MRASLGRSAATLPKAQASSGKCHRTLDPTQLRNLTARKSQPKPMIDTCSQLIRADPRTS